jgi:DNA-binding Xre family transcriptional regulator
MIETMPIYIKFDEIDRLMELRGIRSRAALSKQAGFSRQHLYKIEHKHIDPRLGTISKICDILKCQPGDILENSPE